MDLRALRYFIAVVEVGSLSRAAHSLYVAQPALTAQIKKLEAELGAQLLERSHAGVTPTPAGTQLYQDARRLLSDAEAMGERIRRLPQGPEGSVTIAVPFLLTTLLLGPVIAQLSQTHPRIRVFVLDGLSLTVQKAVLERRADIGIVVDTPALPGLDCQPMAQEDILLTGLDRGAAVVPLLQGDPGGGLPSLAFASAIFERDQFAALQAATPLVWASVIWAGLISSVMATTLVFWLVQKREAGRVTPYLLATPVVSILIGWAFMGDVLTPQILAGAALSIAGVAVVAIAERGLRAGAAKA